MGDGNSKAGQGDGRGHAGAPDISVPVHEEESNPQLTNKFEDIESNSSFSDSDESGSVVSSRHPISKQNEDDSSNNEDESVRRQQLQRRNILNKKKDTDEPESD